MDALQAIGHENNQFLSVSNDQGQTTLHVDVVREKFPMVQYLVERGILIKMTIMVIAHMACH
jgi:hypothetical protein